MATLIELQARLESLRQRRAAGTRSVESGGDRVEYRTDAELAAAIADLERQIAGASGGPVRQIIVETSKGLC